MLDPRLNDNPCSLWRRFNRRHGALALTIKSLIWLFLAGYLICAVTHAHLYRTLQFTEYDQAAIMRLAHDIRASGNPVLTDGNRHPLFPLLIAPFTAWSPEGFVNAKLGGTLSGLLLLTAAFIFLGRRAGTLFSAWFGLMLLFPAGTAQLFSQAVPDPLFALLHGAAALCFALGIERPRKALFGGVLCGLAFLTKYTGLTLVLFFLVFVVGRMLLFQRRDGFALRQSLLSVGLGAAGFLIVALPLLLNNQHRFGSPLYNANTRYFWADSWAECKAFSARVGDREPGRAREREALIRATDPKLSFTGYFQRHSPGFAFMRFYNGLKIYFRVLLEGRFLEITLLALFPLIYFLSVFGFRGDAWRTGVAVPETLFLAAYALFAFCLTGWYAAISVNLRYGYPLQGVVSLLGLTVMMRANHEKPASPRAAVACLGLVVAVAAMLVVKTPLALSRGFASLVQAVHPVHPYP